MSSQQKSILGVTLLEIMLVLAIAAMVILMSVKFYQSSTTSQQTTAFVSQIQTIVSAADRLAQGPNGYTNISLATMQNVLGGPSATLTPWGQYQSITGTVTSFSVVYPAAIPTSVATMVSSELTANPRFSVATPTGFTYDSSQ